VQKLRFILVTIIPKATTQIPSKWLGGTQCLD
jgi:hypothetical protein